MNNISPFRNDALDKVTGDAKYSADFHMDGMVYSKVLWPPVPSCKIIKIDTSEAEKAPGVVRVFTRKDITGPNLTGMYATLDRPVLVGEGEEVRFMADAIALVAAETEDQADRAKDLIHVEYEECPTFHTVAQAKAAGCADCCVRAFKHGNVEEGFAKAAVSVEQEFFNPYGEHAYIEPEAGYAYLDSDNTINVCVGSQDLRQQQRYACEGLGLPFHKLRVFSPYVGGGFGGKHSVSVHVYLALMAYLLRRPVKMVWTREESFAYSCKKQSLRADVKLGLDKDGKICALQARVDGPAGPYLGNGGDSLAGFQLALCGTYKLENIDLEGRLYATTGLELGALRGVGWPDGIFAIETLLNKAAKQLGLDQLTVRKRNWIDNDYDLAHQASGVTSRNVSDKWIIEETMQKALEAAGPLPKPGPGKKTGRGVACAMPAFCIGNSDLHKGSVAELVMYLDGSLIVKMGFPEIGEGITGVCVEFGSRAMGVPREKVHVILGDTHKAPVSGALAFSQATVTGGNAIIKAAELLKEKMAGFAREYLKSDDQSIYYDSGDFYNGKGEKVLDWKTFSAFCYPEVKDLSAAACVVGPPEDKNVFGITPISGVADIELDEDTGEIKVLQIIQSHDTGKVVHLESARGQMFGAAIMTYGAAFMEDFKMKEGRAATPSFAEYLIPTAMDVPEESKLIFIEGNYGHGCPEGAKGLGEHGMYVVGPAIANALFDAMGVCMTHLPITPEKILKELNKI
jgi:CO/xanthine dehydrogenase Mo-binding subunit